MGRLDGRVAIVTGAGRGLGRSHALRLAAEGAAVVVNDLGGALDGTGSSPMPAQEVVNEIQAHGGRALVSNHDVAIWREAGELVRLAVENFGRLDALVNNAGILRDRTLANMAEDQWDAVMAVHAKGHAATTSHAMAYWRARAKAGDDVKASLIHTTSVAAFAGNFGQANYAAAKVAILGLSRVAAIEGERYGVRSNAVSPSAHTRLETSLTPLPEGQFDTFDPANVSPVVAWLAEAECPANGQVFQVYGNKLLIVQLATVAHRLSTTGQWNAEALDRALAGHLVTPPRLNDFVEGLQ
jgi:NAD(P)-dependent dehydrogenase (short-subunit alcohol dehydrogenase family)